MSARSPLLISALLLFCTNLQAITLAEFDQDALAVPQRVEARFKQGITAQDKLQGQALFKAGLKRGSLSKQRDFGPVVKEFCASAVSYPTAHALTLCAQATAYFGKSQASKLAGASRKEYLERSLNYLNGVLASALTAAKYTDVSAKELQNIQTASQCTAQYVATRKKQNACKPLTWLGINY